MAKQLNLAADYGIEAKQKVEVDNVDIERFFVEGIILMKMNWLSVHQL